LVAAHRKKIIERVPKYRSLPTSLSRLKTLEVLPVRSFESLVKSGLCHANAFIFEGLHAFGTAIGIGLVPVLIRAGW
jgi:hypothetical protein